MGRKNFLFQGGQQSIIPSQGIEPIRIQHQGLGQLGQQFPEILDRFRSLSPPWPGRHHIISLESLQAGFCHRAHHHFRGFDDEGLEHFRLSVQGHQTGSRPDRCLRAEFRCSGIAQAPSQDPDFSVHSLVGIGRPFGQHMADQIFCQEFRIAFRLQYQRRRGVQVSQDHLARVTGSGIQI